MYRFYEPIFYPKIPDICEAPPTLYSLLNAIVNFDNPNPVKIKNLPNEGRNIIFDFDYPLTDNIDREDFECLILKHFMMRRIGFETLTAFKLELDVKLNSIMPIYNKMFDALEGWDILNDGEVTTREVIGSSSTRNNLNSTSTSDRRYSETPQNKIQQIKDGSYVTDYNFDTNSEDAISVGTNNNNENETIKHSPADKIRIYKEFKENSKSIYSMILDELDELFYGII